MTFKSFFLKGSISWRTTCSDTLTPSCSSFPMYGIAVKTYEVLTSHKSQNLIPNLEGMYWMKLHFDWQGKSCSRLPKRKKELLKIVYDVLPDFSDRSKLILLPSSCLCLLVIETNVAQNALRFVSWQIALPYDKSQNLGSGSPLPLNTLLMIQSPKKARTSS